MLNLLSTGVSGVDHLLVVTLDKGDVTLLLHLLKGSSGKRTADLHSLDESGGGDQLHLKSQPMTSNQN